jgi:hypothetical protein
MKNLLSIFTFLSLVLFSGCGDSCEGCKVNKNLTTQKTKTIYKNVIKSDIPHDYEEYMEGEKSFLAYDSNNPQDIVAFEKEYLLLTGDQAPIFDGIMIVAKMGTHSSGGYGIDIKSMKENNSSIEVDFYLSTPKNDTFVTMAFTNPFIIVSLDDLHKEIIFKESF